VAAVAKKGAYRPSTPRPPSVDAALVPRGEPPRLPSSFYAHGGRGGRGGRGVHARAMAAVNRYTDC
jgi:hypothetical protein